MLVQISREQALALAHMDGLAADVKAEDADGRVRHLTIVVG